MPKAQISIEVSGRNDLVDALDWQIILLETVTALNNLTRAVGLAENIKPSRSRRWKISRASTQSPLYVTLFEESTDIDDPSQEAVRVYIEGLNKLESNDPPTEAPPFWEQNTLGSVKRLVSVLGRDTGSLIFSAPGMASVSTTERVAINVDELIGAKFKAYGALEGVLETLSVRGQTNFKLYDPFTKYRIRCYLASDRLEEAKAAFPHRVAVYGDIKYSKSGKPISITVKLIRRLRLRRDLPQAKDIEGIVDITGGIDSSEHIRSIRDAE